MPKHRIFIVDDEAPARQRLAMLLSDIQDTCPCELTGEAGNAQEALDAIMSTRPDIVLLDVQMPGMTGIELAHHLGKNMDAAAPAIIFVTAYDEYAVKAFDVHALDYLLKPVRATRLEEAITRASRIRAGAQQPVTAVAASVPARRQHFSVLERGRVLLVPVAEVLFLKAEQKYVTLHTSARTYLLEEPLVSIEEEMADVLVRVHRNALIARNAIRGVERVSHITGQSSGQSTNHCAGHAADADGDLEKVSESWQVILRDTDERLPISRRQWSVIKSLVR